MTNTTRFASILHPCLALAACGDNARGLPDAPPPPPMSRAVIVAGDFTMGHPGILTTLDPDSRAIRSNAGPAMAVGADPILRHIGRELLIVNRIEHNITILDDETLSLEEQLGTGAGSNPQDVAVLGDKLYVATFKGKGLTVLARGSTATTVIDLSAEDPDGEPNCNSVFLVGTRLFVSCELFDDLTFTLRGPGKIYVVDTATDTLHPELTVTLGHENPFGLFEQIPEGAPHAGDLMIPTIGGFPIDLAAGCIERVATGGTPAAAGCVLQNTMVGGYPIRIAFAIESGLAMMWTAIAVPRDPQPPLGDLRGFDLAASSLWEPAVNPKSQIVADVAYCPSGQTVVVDSTANANGLRVYQSTTEQTAAPLPIGLGFFSSHGLVCY
ncbi:MAG TPA: hypothetical protein VFD36_13265 [Kofleriaceae bacterium]|nr:hypothetical protein [Kofleriaceae bacterium]